MSTTLARLSAARTALSQAKSMEDILAIRDIAEAARVYAKAARESLAAQNFAAEIKLRAERKAGELLKQMEKRNGSRGVGKKVDSQDDRPLLSDIGVGHNESKRWQKEATVSEAKFEELITECTDKGKELTQAELLRVAGAGHVSQATGENEWYTPPEWIEAARKAMGGIDLDPASCEIAQKHIKAKKFFSIADDGLSKVWRGRVWLNPPYSRDLCAKFTERLLFYFQEESIKQACVLVNNATDTAWMQELLHNCSAVCFPAGRISFLDRSGKPANKPLQGQAVVYLGERVKEFKTAFEDRGVVLFGC